MRGTRPLALLALSLATLAPPAAVSGQPETDGPVRIGDSPDPVLAAIDISEATFADGEATGAVIGRDDVFPDNLAGAPLAGADRTLLYTTGGPDQALRPEVLAEVRRALADARGCADDRPPEVFILGGEAAVSAAAEQTFVEAGYCVQRFAGSGRQQTALAIGQFVIGETMAAAAMSGAPNAIRPIITRSDSFADAAPAGVLAAGTGDPIFITNTNEAFDGMLAALADLREADPPSTEALIIGGTAAIGDMVEGPIADLGYTVTRAAGPTRLETAIEIARLVDQHMVDQDMEGFQVLEGFSDDAWTNAFAAAPRAARDRTAQLWTVGDHLSQPTGAFIEEQMRAFCETAEPRERAPRINGPILAGDCLPDWQHPIIGVGPGGPVTGTLGAPGLNDRVLEEAYGLLDPKRGYVGATATSTNNGDVLLINMATGGTHEILSGVATGSPSFTHDGTGLLVPMNFGDHFGVGELEFPVSPTLPTPPQTVRQIINLGTDGFAVEAILSPDGQTVALTEVRQAADGGFTVSNSYYDAVNGALRARFAPNDGLSWSNASPQPWVDDTRALSGDLTDTGVINTTTGAEERLIAGWPAASPPTGTTVASCRDGVLTIDLDQIPETIHAVPGCVNGVPAFTGDGRYVLTDDVNGGLAVFYQTRDGTRTPADWRPAGGFDPPAGFARSVTSVSWAGNAIITHNAEGLSGRWGDYSSLNASGLPLDGAAAAWQVQGRFLPATASSVEIQPFTDEFEGFR